MISVCDALTEGGGKLDVFALGLIPMVCAHRTAALVRGELMRYLAELAVARPRGCPWLWCGLETVSIWSCWIACASVSMRCDCTGRDGRFAWCIRGIRSMHWTNSGS